MHNIHNVCIMYIMYIMKYHTFIHSVTQVTETETPALGKQQQTNKQTNKDDGLDIHTYIMYT